MERSQYRGKGIPKMSQETLFMAQKPSDQR